ncbi:MAG: hypothetical protein AAF549_04390 [Pseudomonadota bacterium]
MLSAKETTGDGGEGFVYPRSLQDPRLTLGGAVKVIDASNFPAEMQNLIVLAANKQPIPNCDSLMYFPENDKNWGRIAAGRTDNGEDDVIRRAAQAHARVLHPPETMGFWTIGPGDAFDKKERIVIEAHLAEGHSFDSFMYSDINEGALTKSIDDGRRVAQELGLVDVKHIPILGDVFSNSHRKANQSLLGKSRVLATSFGFTLQNLRNSVSGYTEATTSLTDTLDRVRKWLPKGSRLFATLDHQKDSKIVETNFTGPQHEDFFQTGVAHHLGRDVADVTELRRVFTPNTAILNRRGHLTEDVAFNLGERGFVVLQKGTQIWNGVSARIPQERAVKAFEDAKWDRVFPDPISNLDQSLACHVALKR